MFYNCFFKNPVFLKLFIFFIYILSFKSLAMLSVKEQYHGFLKYQKKQQAFDKIRKKSFAQYKRDFEFYQNQRNKILKHRLKQNRTIDQKEKQKLVWKKTQDLAVQHHEASRKAYLKERAVFKRQNKKYPRPQSLPYKSPL